MLRAVLVGLLSVTAVGCKSGGDSPKAQQGVAAGKVLEASGSVTVRHAGVARPLATGETVEGDDVIETGADGDVIIELAHNLARWELGANKRSKVSDSAAWSLPKQTGSVAAVEQDTAAAGRPAERSAADTSVSASQEAPRAPAAETARAPAADMAPAPVAERKPTGTAPPPRAAAVASPPPAPRPAAVAPPPPPRLPARAKRDASSETTAAPSGGARRGAAAPASAAHDLVIRNRSAIEACLRKDLQAVSLRITIDEHGKATTLVKATTDVPDAVKRCVLAAVDKIEFAPAAATVTVDIAR